VASHTRTGGKAYARPVAGPVLRLAASCDRCSMSTHTPHLTRELDTRESDGIEVRMLWRAHDDRVLVAVSDSRTGEAFSVEVRAGERAPDVFHHPYAYAAARGIDTRSAADALAAAA
jgi:hypothetical protein